MTELWRWSAIEARRALDDGAVSAAELVETSLDRIDAEDPSLRAFLTLCPERARAEAQASDRRRAAGEPSRRLEGLPFAVKDLTDTAGVRTTYGSRPFADHVPQADELCVARLRAAGAILVGKTNTPEFGFGPRSGNSLCGPTANPYDAAFSAGGSSGGSAAAVAAGLVPLAQGTDFGGSVRTPASFCGVVGLRPTPGLVPSATKELAWNALATHGILARSVDDAALMLSAMAGHDARDPLSRPGALPDADRPTPADGLRIGVSADLGVAPVAREVRAAFGAAAEAIAGTFAATEAADPDCAGAVEAFATLRAAIVHRQYAALVEAHGAALTEPLVWNVGRGLGLSADAMLKAEEARSRVFRAFTRYFDQHDVLVTPAAAVPPFARTGGDVLEIDGCRLDGPIHYLAITFVISLVGLPCLSIPCGWTAAGLPIGMQVVVPPWREDRLLAVARRFERALGFRHRWPAAAARPLLSNAQS